MAISSVLGSSALAPAGLGFRNVIVNGGMDVWQRGTSGFATSDGTYTADRWRHTSNNLTITQDTDVPSGFRYSAKLVGTSDNSFAQRIEAAVASKLAVKQVYLSFWAKRTSGTGALDVRFYYPSATDNFTTNTQIGSTIVVSSSPSSSWTYYTATLILPSNVSTGLMVLINNVGAATTFITGVQLEQNNVPTPFEQRPIGVELQLCQRYYENSGYPKYSIPTAVTGQGAYIAAANAYRLCSDVYFKVTKRDVPTVTIYNTNDLASGSTTEFLAGTGFITNRTSTVLYPSTTKFGVESSAQFATGREYNFSWKAEIEL